MHSPARKIRVPSVLVSLVACAASCGGSLAAAADAPPTFSFERVVDEARRLAASPFFERAAPALPDAFARLAYDDYRRIRPSADTPLGPRFRVRLFHRGYLYGPAVEVNVVEDGVARRVAFDPSRFAYPSGLDAGALPSDLGFGGAGLDFVPTNGAPEQIVSFLGASYFRGRGLADAGYGVSARAVAVNAGEPDEEFPRISRLWFVEGGRDAASATIFALLDGPSVVGACRFDVRPGDETAIDVETRLFPRKSGGRLSFAPLTSMFLHGENAPAPASDYRPEVHDSDGLFLVDGNGERLFRPLRNPAGPERHAFHLASPRAFGLLQRDRAFDHYQDVEAAYDRRPSAWIEPQGDWGAGTVELVELHAADEFTDNVVVAWRPDKPAVVGDETRCRYALRFGDVEPSRGGRAVATRFACSDRGTRVFVDFAGVDVATGAGTVAPEAVLAATGGTVGPPVVQYVAPARVWRVFFDIDANAGRTADLRCFLRRGDAALTETWTTSWSRK